MLHRETQLSKRVADWTSRLEPILRAQELAPEYNIHTYSDLVLTQVGSVSEMDLERRFRVLGLNSDENTGREENAILNTLRTNVRTDRAVVDFQEIVGDEEGRSSGEVCRVFLACLMLANAGNLDLIPQPAMEKPVKTGKSTGGKGQIEKNNFHFNKKSSFHVRILKNSRNQDIEEFRAPSVFTEY
jgi:Condensin II complex subunit CAP-H2 or CNDH2, C-term